MKVKCFALLSFLGIVLAFGFTALPTASAHVGDDPHVPIAYYNNYANVDFNIQPNMAHDAWADAASNINNNVTGVNLDANSNDCAGPGKCINVLINRDCESTGLGCGKITILRHSSGSDTLVYLEKNGVTIGQKRACRGMQWALGQHLHHGDGCLNSGAGTQTVTICCGEAFQLTNAYCNSCRPLPSEEQFGFDFVDGDGDS